MKNLFFILFFSFIAFYMESGAANAESPQGKAIEIILDCSGSMTARMPDGKTRIQAAREAVEKAISSIPDDVQIAFRVYGSKSPKEKHDCNDTELIVPFGLASDNRANVISIGNGLQALGYTPITKVIQIASSDFPADSAGEKVLVLVSDGKETCEGDPCAAARDLAKSGAKLLIHTIGFGVDDAARFELECIARATGGSYFGAEDTGQLASILSEAFIKNQEVISVETGGSGFLQVKNPDFRGHKVVDAASGKKMGVVTPFKSKLQLPAGIYNVTFGAGTWKSVEVRKDGTTVIEPGQLKVNKASLKGHKVMDSETGAVHGEVTSLKNTLTLIPGLYDISFGSDLVWPQITVSSGTVTTLNPGLLQVKKAISHDIYASDGRKVGTVSNVMSMIPLPPGDYSAGFGEKKVPFTIVEGKVVIIDAR